jgi:hypothetical protein
MRKIPILFCVASIFLFASYVHAASVSFIAPANIVPIGTPFYLEVHLETDTDSLNVINGTVSIPDGIRITDVETGNSLLKLWPTPPTYIPGKKQIVFVGGTPDGLPTHTDGLLFRITAIAERDGAYQFTSSSTRGYVNNGMGTILLLPPNTITVQASGTAQPNNQVSVPATPSPDLTPPVFNYVDVGRDQSLFNNEYYVTFQASDAESGIDYYEVKEGFFGSYVRANRYYVLQDQTLRTPIIIRAVDKAGNAATWIVPAEHPSPSTIIWPFILAAIILFFILTLLRRRRVHKA